jgi:hypothetical protein
MVTSQEDLLSRLLAVPSRIENIIDGLSQKEMRTSLGKDWSIAEIMAHIRASDEILASHVYMILARDNPPIADFDERRWAEVAGYAQGECHVTLRVFALRREELVRTLKTTSAEDWQRKGTHEKRGLITILGETVYLVDHEEEHCAEMEKIRAELIPS